MSSATLLVLFTSQNIGLFCCALFAGAATYVSLVEHPTMAEGGAELVDSYALMSHPRPVVLQASFGAVGALAGILAGLAGGSAWWLAGGTLLGAATVLHVYPGIRLTRSLLDVDRHADPKTAAEVLAKITKLHALLSLAGLASLFMFIAKA